MLTDMGTHSAPLRLAETPDRIIVLAGAMRAFARTPGSADARKELDAAMRGCTDNEYEAAWAMAQMEEVPVLAPAAPRPEATAAAPAEPATRRALTGGQRFLAVLAVVLEMALAPVFFLVMFVTVNTMLGPSFGFWAWTVPVATEITFALLLVLAILFEWMRRPVPALWKLPYLFAALSSFMNVWAGRGSVAGIAGHLAVTAAFFIPLGFAKTTVRKLIVTPAERQRAQAIADARAHATDVLRSALGPFWRQRTPLLLRRQIRSGRLPAAVMGAVETADAAKWEPAVQAWITAAVTLPARVAEALRAASAVRVADTGQDSTADTDADNAADKSSDNRADSHRDKSADNVPDISADNRRTTTVTRAASKPDKVADPVTVMIKRRPRWDDEKIAAECGVHPRTVKRRRQALADAAPGVRATA
jgi:hypothetical protein